MAAMGVGEAEKKSIEEEFKARIRYQTLEEIKQGIEPEHGYKKEL